MGSSEPPSARRVAVVGRQSPDTTTVLEGLSAYDVDHVPALATIPDGDPGAIVLVTPALEVPLESAIDELRRVYGDGAIVVAAADVPRTTADAVTPLDPDAVAETVETVLSSQRIARPRRRLQRIHTATDAIPSSADEQAVCDRLVGAGYDAAWIVLSDGSAIEATAAAGVPRAALRVVDVGGDDPVARAVRGGDPVVDRDDSTTVAVPYGDHCLVCTTRESVTDAEVAVLERLVAGFADEATRPQYVLLGEALTHEVNNHLDLAMVQLDLVEEDSEHVDHVETALSRISALLEEVGALVATDLDVSAVSLEATARQVWAAESFNGAAIETTDATVAADERLLRLTLSNLFRNAVEHGTAGTEQPAGTPGRGGDDPTSTAARDAADATSSTADDDDRPAATAAADGDRESMPADESTEPDADEWVSPAEDPSITIRVGPLEDGGFYVEDDGTGFPASAREHIFEWGWSGNGGTGIGLALVSLVADRHGWELSASGEDGARFEFHP